MATTTRLAAVSRTSPLICCGAPLAPLTSSRAAPMSNRCASAPVPLRIRHSDERRRIHRDRQSPSLALLSCPPSPTPTALATAPSRRADMPAGAARSCGRAHPLGTRCKIGAPPPGGRARATCCVCRIGGRRAPPPPCPVMLMRACSSSRIHRAASPPRGGHRLTRRSTTRRRRCPRRHRSTISSSSRGHRRLPRQLASRPRAGLTLPPRPSSALASHPALSWPPACSAPRPPSASTPTCSRSAGAGRPAPPPALGR